MSGTIDRVELAKWYAGRHLEIDPGVERIQFLPKASPPTEIRFVEVNRLISDTADLEPIDFGVDIEGAEGHTLVVLDVTPDQWDGLQKGWLKLPAGWTLEGSETLAERAR